MKLCIICKKCDSPNCFNYMVNDRVELSMKKGESFMLRCKKCDFEKEYHVNEVFAKPNIVLNLIIFLIVLLSTVFLGIFLFKNYWEYSIYMVFLIPMTMAIPSMIYFTYIKSQNKKIRTFNNYRK